jgi:hypothetical protein
MNHQGRRRWLFRVADALEAIPFAFEVAIAVASLGGVVALVLLWL